MEHFLHPEDVLTHYFSLIEQEKYEEMYNLVNLPENYSKEDFLARNKNIYQGIEANNIQIENGLDILHLQKLLGHSGIRSTVAFIFKLWPATL